jgi:hypothetical protein
MVPAMAAAFGVTTHLDRLTIQRWTKQIVAGGGLTGQDVVQTSPPRVTNMALSVDEQPFATIDVDLKATQANGSSSPMVSGTVGPLRPRDAQGRGSCSWQFARGATSSLVPPPSTTSTTASTTSTTPTTMTATTILPLLTIAPLPRTITLTGFTAAGPASAVAPRTITLTGFTAQGPAAAVAPRTITLTGFTAQGPAAAVVPRTIVLPGWTAAGP